MKKVDSVLKRGSLFSSPIENSLAFIPFPMRGTVEIAGRRIEGKRGRKRKKEKRDKENEERGGRYAMRGYRRYE